jgi:hypothetical protein
MEGTSMSSMNKVRYGAAGLLAVCGFVLAGCAGVPATRPMALEGDRPAVKFNTGRVTVYVTDFAGRPLTKAMVDVESTGRDHNEYFRTAAFSDVWGRVTFNGVPEQVRISVYHAETQGNYSRVFDVPSTGITELRMLLETQVQ